MAKQLLIKAKERENKNPNSIRRDGFIPATVYGHSLESKSVQVYTKEFSRIPHKAYSHINELEVEGKEKFPVIIRNVQTDPVKDTFLNIEFYRIKENEKLKVKVGLQFTGHSAAVGLGGVLVIAHTEIEIQCLPKDIPDFIEAKLEKIADIGQALLSKDVEVPANVQILTRPDEVLCKVEAPKTHEVEEVKPVADATAVTAATPAAGAAAPAAAGKEAAPKADAKPAKK